MQNKQQPSTPAKFAIYSRKSKFTEKGDSVDVQIDLCKNYVRLSHVGQTIADDDFIIFVDEGYSGKNTERPRFQAMMEMAKKKEFQTVICYRIDRISRNIIDFHGFTEQLQKLDISFVSITESCDTSTPMGRAMLSICSVFAQLERETIAERIRHNMQELAKSGRWLGGTPPTGYRSVQLVDQVTEDGKARKAFKLEMIPEEVDLVKLVFEKFLETNALTKVETFCLQNHVKTKNGKPFTRFAIKNILQNPVYAAADQHILRYFQLLNEEIYADESRFDGKHGIMAYNKTEQNGAQTHVCKDIEDWIIAIGKHHPIISGEVWIKVQDMLDQNKSKSYRKPKSHVALLSGLLFCGHCKSYMRPKMSQRLNQDNEFIYSYLCQTKEVSHQANCRMKNPNGNELDALVCQAVKAHSMDHSAFRKKMDTLQKEIQQQSNLHDEVLKTMKSKYQENENAIKNLVQYIISLPDTAAKKYITDEIDQRHQENERIKQDIQNTEAMSKQQSIDDMQFDLLKKQMLLISQSIDSMSVEEKRMALRLVIRKIIWDGENAHIFFFGDNDGGKEKIDYDGISVSDADIQIEPLGDNCK